MNAQVLRLDGAHYDPAAFARRGIRVLGPEVLAGAGPGAGPGPGGAADAALRRFGELVAGAGGGVAVHCEGRLAEACTLLVAGMREVDMLPNPEASPLSLS